MPPLFLFYHYHHFNNYRGTRKDKSACQLSKLTRHGKLDDDGADPRTCLPRPLSRQSFLISSD